MIHRKKVSVCHHTDQNEIHHEGELFHVDDRLAGKLSPQLDMGNHDHEEQRGTRRDYVGRTKSESRRQAILVGHCQH